jgi:hypothetical protein
MSSFLANISTNAWPYLIVLILCVFWLLAGGMQSRVPGDGKKGDGARPAWRGGDVASPLRRIWHVTRKARRS